MGSATTMHGSVEEQLLTCQEMFLEIERQVASMSAMGMGGEQGAEGSSCQQEAADLLSCRLELLKTSLVSFQLLLLERQEEEQTQPHHHHAQQQPSPQKQRPPEAKLKRSASVQEMFSSPRNKLLRQSSVKQQKELEQELCEQRGLTQAIARQGSRARLLSQDSEEHARQATRSAATEADGKGEEPIDRKWEHLLGRLAGLEQSSVHHASMTMVSDSSGSQAEGVSGCVIIDSSILAGLQSHGSRLRELGHSAAQICHQAVPDEGLLQRLEEGLFDVLSGVSLSLSVLANLLQSPPGTTHEEDTQLRLLQLQSVSSELSSLGSELVSQGSKVSGALGSGSGGRCVELLSRVLTAVQTGLTRRLTRLETLLEQTRQHQRKVTDLHAALTSNQLAVNQITNGANRSQDINLRLQAVAQLQQSLQQQACQVSSLLEEVHRQELPASLIHQATHLQGEVEGALAGACGTYEELKNSVELQRHHERLATSLDELLTAGAERLSRQPGTELHSRAGLQQQLSDHMKFFQFLGNHLRNLQYLTQRVPQSALQRWEGVVKELQDRVNKLLHKGLERGIAMQETLQTWTQWEEDSAWLDSLLRELETASPRVHLVEDSEEKTAENLTACQKMKGVLEESRARFRRTLEAGLRLQGAGCRGVGGVTRKLEAHWTALHRRAEHERTVTDRNRKLGSRLTCDSAALNEWMNRAREMIGSWSQLANQETELNHSRDHYQQFVEFTKDLEAKSGLKASVLSRGTQLLHLSETDRLSRRDTGDRLSPSSKNCSEFHADSCPVQSQLSQMAMDWANLLANVPLLQQALHKRYIETVSQDEALAELQSWLGGVESRVEEQQQSLNQPSSNSSTDLCQILTCYKECHIELSAHQATLDYVNQPVLHICTAPDGQRGCCEHTRFSEELGAFNHRWLSLRGTLNSQIQEVEQQMRGRADREGRLQQLIGWISAHRCWLTSALAPDSQSEVAERIATCEDHETMIRQKLTVLQELREKHSREGGGFICLVDGAIRSCTALLQQNSSVQQRLAHIQELWDRLDIGLKQTVLTTLRTSHILGYHGNPQLCLQAHRDVLEVLQLLRTETEGTDTEWDGLTETLSSLGDMISPSVAALISEHRDRERARWSQVSAELERCLQRGQRLLQVWAAYARLAGSFSQQLHGLQLELQALLDDGAPGLDNTTEMLTTKIQAAHSLQERTDMLQTELEGALQASKVLVDHLEPPAAALIQSESRLMSRGIMQLGQSLSQKLAHMQEDLGQAQQFDSMLESLERHLGDWQDRLKHVSETAAHRDTTQSELVQFFGLCADLDVVNELSHSVTLGDKAAQRLQCLNRLWAHTSNTSMDTCSELQMEALRRQKFQEKCESWMSFLQRMEDSLAVELAGTYTGLREQLCTHQRFQAELSTGHQILHSVITEALHLLHRGEVEDRSDFILKLSQLREHWQGAVQRASQRRSLVEGLVKHWHQYNRSLRKLQRFLSHAQTLLPPAGPARCSLTQHRRTLLELQHTELWFQRYQCSYLHTVELGRQLFSMGDQDTQEQLQQELGNLQEDWDNLQGLLAKRTELTYSIVKTWEQCEARLGDGVLRVKDVKTRLNQSMPDYVDELQRAEHFNKESNRDSLEEDWAESLTELSAMKTDLSQYIIADDVLLLQEQVEHLHCHWEELCLKVSLRKQEIADRLNAWIIFNDKNKELCEWLTQMENKVAHNNSDLSIEEMVEKLKKDCMEEMNLFSENKTHLKQLGEQLITASNKTKETEVNDKLKDINDRWQHLFDHIDARVRKLKETLVTVQQLDKNMSNLRTWLSRIEAELSKPVVYSVCHSDEIQRKLAEQQDLQRDIEQHTEGVASVLTLCDVLLHDADACGGGSDSENDSIQQTTRSLDRRWRNICAMSMERRMRIEETWRLWCKFLDDYSRFEDWLKTAEQTAANPVSAHVLYTSAKEELKKFEAFQRQVHERLTQLELVNKQYRRLARENRTDAASRLKVMVHEGNLRWDHLQRRVAAVLRRLKHFTSQREDFEGTREAILVWLTEMDLQLTNVEHFSESDIEDKMRQLNGFQQEITLNTNKIDALIVFGENLIQKSAPLDAVLIEDELEELHSYCQEVFGRVARFHQRLVNRRPVLEEERELSDRDTDLEDSPDLSSTPPSWRAQKEEEEVGGGGVSAGRQVAAVCHHLLAPPLERCSGRETPVSVDSIPLEWDHTVDVGGSSSHEDDEDATFFSALSDVEVTESTESFVKATAKALKGASVKSVTDPPNWHQSDTPERKRVPRGLDSSPTHTTSTPYHPQGYVKLMAECSGSVNSVKRVKLILNDEEDLDEPGLTGSTADKHTSTAVIERWELIQVQGLGQDMDIKQDLEQWQKLNSSLCDITSWLGRVRPELERLQRLAPATSLRDMEGHIRRLKEMQKTFNSYKCVLISVNLSSRRFQRGDSAELQELQEGLRSVNHSWTQACSALESWERRLQQALMECQEFHEMLHSLLMWLARAENRCYAVNIHDPKTPHTALLEHRETLLVLDRELRAGQRQVSSMQELSSHLLLEASSSSGESGEEEEDSVEAKEKLHVISNKLRLLLRQVAADLLLLQGRLESCPSSLEMDSMGLGTLMSPLLLQKEGFDPSTATVKPTTTRRDRKRDSSPPRPFFQRVLRAAFPLHILFLLLLVLACLVPMSEEDFSCTLTNNFARSFYPMLRYTNGPPPT